MHGRQGLQASVASDHTSLAPYLILVAILFIMFKFSVTLPRRWKVDCKGIFIRGVNSIIAKISCLLSSMRYKYCLSYMHNFIFCNSAKINSNWNVSANSIGSEFCKDNHPKFCQVHECRLGEIERTGLLVN